MQWIAPSEKDAANDKLEKKPESPSANDGAVQVYSSGIGGQVTPDGYSVNT